MNLRTDFAGFSSPVNIQEAFKYRTTILSITRKCFKSYCCGLERFAKTTAGMTPLELGKGRGSLKNRGALTSLGFRARSGVTAPLQLASKVTIYSNGNPIVTKEVSEALAKCKLAPTRQEKSLWISGELLDL